MDHITLLVEDWFTGVRPRFLVVPCPHCSHGLTGPTQGRDRIPFLRSFSINPQVRPPNDLVDSSVSFIKLTILINTCMSSLKTPFPYISSFILILLQLKLILPAPSPLKVLFLSSVVGGAGGVVKEHLPLLLLRLLM